MKEFEDYIKTWVTDFVSVHNETLGQIPCPYAKAAKVKYIFNDEMAYDIMNQIYKWDDAYEVVVMGCEKDQISAEHLRDIISPINENQDQFYLMRDHPDEDDVIQGVNMSNGKYTLVFIQKRAALIKAVNHLETTTYYDNWTEEELAEVVECRK